MLQTNPTCADMILTNIPRSFRKTCVGETGLFDYHLMSITVMTKNCRKFQPNVISCRSYKNA